MTDELLYIEDDPLLGIEMKRHFESIGWIVRLVRSIEDAEPFLFGPSNAGLVVLSDMHLPDGNSLDLLERARSQGDQREWIFLTGFGEAPDAVRAMRLGAFDFLNKPVDHERLDRILAAARRGASAQRRIADETSKRKTRYTPDAFIGESEPAARVRAVLERLCDASLSAVVILGETGTGKGLATRILHHCGKRATGPLIEVNCAALPRELLESELFGHEAGAFTGAKTSHRGLMEQASGGTLFLDEIAEMDFDLQAKLLKAIEDKSIRRLGGEREIAVDLQIIAASNRDLRQLAADNRFRPDLLHRLAVFQIELPPLRSRKADIDELVDRFVQEFNAIASRSVKRVSKPVRGRLHAYDWPGNIRELRNVIERSVLLSTGEELPEEWLQLDGRAGPAPTSPGEHVSSADVNMVHLPLDGSLSLDEMERRIIEAALIRNNHNVMATARDLGVSRETLRYRVERHGLKKPMNNLQQPQKP